MWKAFEEMEVLGWVSGKRPKMIAVQSSGSAPLGSGPLDELILDIIRQSGGLTLGLEDAKTLASLRDWARHEGILLSHDGAGATAAYDQLIANGWLSREEKVVIFNTGAGLNYADVIAAATQLETPSTTNDVERDHRGKALPSRYRVGGIITPQ
jgi:threonine synthase